MPRDSTPQLDKYFEYVPPSVHLSQFDEFEIEDNVEKEQENESVPEYEALLQPLCEHVINPIFEKCILHESPNDQCFDIFEDDECTYLDDLFEENIEMHTQCFKNADENCDDACMDDNLLLHEK